MEIDSTPLGLHALTKAACTGWFICYVHDILGGILASNTACKESMKKQETQFLSKRIKGGI